MNYWIEEDDEADEEYRSLVFHPEAIKEMHDALDIEESSHEGAYAGKEGSGQINDYHLLDICPNGTRKFAGEGITTEAVPIDWRLVNIIRKLNDEGVETYGCDQGGIVPSGKVWEFDQWDYDEKVNDLVKTEVKLHAGEVKNGFITFNMDHEDIVIRLFSDMGLKPVS